MRPSPTKEDTTKLNAEVNYYLNQQVKLLITAISIVGVVLAWVTQKTNPTDFKTLDVAYLGASTLLAFLTVIAVIETRLDISIAICTTYLKLSAVSNWERDKANFNIASPHHRRIRISSRQVVYLALGGLAAGWPAMLAVIVFHADAVSVMSALHIGVSGVYVVAVFFLMPIVARARIAEIEATWQEVFRIEDQGVQNDV